MAGGVVLSLGALLDWTGVAYSSTLDRGLAMAAGLLSVFVALVALWRWASVMWLGLVAAALGLNMGIVNYVDVSTHSYEYTGYPNARVGVGIYLVVVGALLVLLGTVLWVTRRRKVQSSGRLRTDV